MNKIIAIVGVLVVTFQLRAQDSGWKSLGGAEKVWVILHPFSAKKAYRLSKEVLRVVDSIKPTLNQQFNGSGSRLDAFRHAYWMSTISARIGPKRALWLGKAHEKKNEKDFKKSRLEDGSTVDKAAIEMDLFNNNFGVKVGKYCYNCSNTKLINTSLDAVLSGELMIIRHNFIGEFLNQNNFVIKNSEWEGKFENERNLVRSNFGL